MKKQFREDIIAEVKKDYEARRAARRQFEAQWQLNGNFVMGNQYCLISVRGEVEDTGRDYYWQEREVFNHIASITETRLARLNKVRPKMSVRPATGDDEDIKSAAVASKILSSVSRKLAMDDLLARGTQWSEIAGSVFYKVSWDADGGRTVGVLDGEQVKEGEVRVDVCPPYEIFPDRLTAQDIDEVNSLIHAKAVPVSDIKRMWGEDVAPEDVDVLGMSGVSVMGGFGSLSAVPRIDRSKAGGSALVIERYTRPTADKPNGELVIVAGDKLLHYGDLPYAIGKDGERDLPFVKQDAIVQTGCFYGASMVERAIPIQRAYNAVKNRKHEFLNRISMGVLAVEDGSVDTENLETDGLSPGKILVYRQGSNPPALLNPGNVPADFSYEEDRLLNEFIMVSGVSEVTRSSSVPGSITSGAAIQLLLEQDDTRLSCTAERIRNAARLIARYILRLYKQFAVAERLSRCVGTDGAIELIYWKGSLLDSDDVVFDTENELNDSVASRRNMVFELLRSGLLHDENGRLSDEMRYKVLDALGYGGWEQTRDLQKLHIARAARENLAASESDITVNDIDDHALHIAEHTKFMLGADFEKISAKNPEFVLRLNAHVAEHKLREQGKTLQREGEENGID